jgi:integrase
MTCPFSPTPKSLWPPVDALRWEQAKIGGKLFDKGGAADWRPATQWGAEKAWGTFLTWLDRHGLLRPGDPMEQRVRPELIEQFIAEYQVGRAPLTVAGTVRSIAQMLRACSPPDGSDWLSQLGWSMMNSAKPARSKMPRIASPRDLLKLADKLMQEGRQGSKINRRGALLYRNGLMTACLAARPMRLGEFMALRLGKTLIRQDEGWLIHIPPGMTKSRRLRRQSFPNSLTSAIDFYVEHLRPTFFSKAVYPDNGALWVGCDGPLLPTSVSNVVSQTTLKGLGKSISPHLFRDCAATAIALDLPEEVGITKSVLGHATLKSSQDYYNQAKSMSASTELADVILQVRRAT